MKTLCWIKGAKTKIDKWRILMSQWFEVEAYWEKLYPFLFLGAGT